MDLSSLLTDSKWNMVKELSKGPTSPSELAKKINTSIANVSQQLKLLEAYGVVKRKKILNNENQPGKPKINYELAKDVMELTFITKNIAVRKSIEQNFITKAIILSNVQLKHEDSFLLVKFIFQNEEVLEKCDAIGISKISPEAIDLLLITEHIHEIREKYSNQTLKNYEGNSKKIVCWTHNMTEIENGIKTKEDHFMKLTNNLKEFLDKNHTFEKIEDMKNGNN